MIYHMSEFWPFPLTAYHFSELSFDWVFFFKPDQFNPSPFVLFRFVLWIKKHRVVYLRYVFTYLLMFCKFFAYLLMFCKFCPCLVILALKYRISRTQRTTCRNLMEIPDLQVLSFEWVIFSPERCLSFEWVIILWPNHDCTIFFHDFPNFSGSRSLRKWV